MRPPELDQWELIARLAMATGLGAVIGLEREWRDRTAGLRTHMLVCLGSAAFTIVSAYGFRDWYATASGQSIDVSGATRIAAQIVSGIGFLGAGAIFRSEDGIRGLTTAASLWMMAAIGMAAGAGYYELAVAATLMILVVLVALRSVGRFIKLRNRDERVELQVVVAGPTEIGNVFETIAGLGGVVSDFHAAVMRAGRSKRRLAFHLGLPEDQSLPDVIGRLAMLEGVESVSAPTVQQATDL